MSDDKKLNKINYFFSTGFFKSVSKRMNSELAEEKSYLFERL